MVLFTRFFQSPTFQHLYRDHFDAFIFTIEVMMIDSPKSWIEICIRGASEFNYAILADEGSLGVRKREKCRRCASSPYLNGRWRFGKRKHYDQLIPNEFADDGES